MIKSTVYNVVNLLRINPRIFICFINTAGQFVSKIGGLQAIKQGKRRLRRSHITTASTHTFYRSGV
jgi:hypothetical protein